MINSIQAPEDRLPVGISDFLEIRSQNQIYVDKTDLIAKLAAKRRFYFFARPRRFGKSLLISTFATLFGQGASAFTGLKAAGLWKDKTYPVVKLDFSNIQYFTTPENFLNQLFDHVQSALTEANLHPVDLGENKNPGLLLKKTLAQTGSQVVLLIDEYDAPLGYNIYKEDLFPGAQLHLSAFFNYVKQATANLRFLFITGILKFRQAEIFSGFNNVLDISLDPEYGTLLGYTEEELKYYFQDYIDFAAHIHECSPTELLDKMREMYDGYCFDSAASTHVYTPWSVLNFLDEPQKGFKPY